MIFGNTILTDEITALREENANLRRAMFELIDKYVHNRVPERLVKAKSETPIQFVESGMDDPVSIAERQAYEESKPKGYDASNYFTATVPTDA